MTEKKKSECFNISLRMTMIFIFSLMFFATFITFVSLFYFHVNTIVERAALLLMDKNADLVFKELEDDVKTFKLNENTRAIFYRSLAKHHFGSGIEISLMQPPSTLIATSSGTTNLPLEVQEAFGVYRKIQHEPFIFRYDSQHYIAAMKAITTDSGEKWFIVITAPAIIFTSAVHHIELSYILIFAAIFILGLLIISSLATYIVNPIKKLVNETKKIKNFEIDMSHHVDSSLREVIDLSNAIDSMKIGLRAFEKYVPRDLVRQLIQAGVDAKVGGSKLNLAIFFSDIQNFTAITETLSSNALVEQINIYFESLSEIIANERGTIDKYIGDSIMAFWGAPFAIDNPSLAAGLAALRCKEKLKQLNSFFDKEHEPIFKTRIAIHFGEAIVGNIGSSQRLNYTVLGDNVNIASRLVNVNKIYGTEILVSEIVYQQLQEHFIFRLIDKVILRGVTHSMLVYELLAMEQSQLTFDIDEYNKSFATAFAEYQLQNWQNAKGAFMQCLAIYPGDSLSVLFITRCEFFVLNAPGPLWNGTYQVR